MALVPETKEKDDLAWDSSSPQQEEEAEAMMGWWKSKTSVASPPHSTPEKVVDGVVGRALYPIPPPPVPFPMRFASRLLQER